MALSLPANPDLERFRRDARRLQRAVRLAEPEALAHAARHHPEGVPSDPTTFALADAQLVVARAYGLPSWPRLRAYLRAAAPLTRDPAALDPSATDGAKSPTAHPEEGSASAVLALACLTYTERDEPARWARAAQLLADEPHLVDRSIFVAAVAGDAEAVARHLAADPSAASREGGPFRWAPLLHVVYSRMPQRDPVETARLLLDAGADPDAGYLWQGLPTPFTALTGAFGEGEQGPARQPRHPQWRPLAQLLLARGADPNDRQALYNRMFTRDDSHLELLLAHGLGRPASEVWARRTGEPAETVDEMVARQVHWARRHGFHQRLALLAAHGLLPDQVVDTGGHVERAAGEAVADAAAEAAADVHLAASPEAVRAAVAAGADLDARRDGRTALHQAAYMDDVELVQALLDAGADPEARDDSHGTRPLEWARWARAASAEALLRRVTRTDAGLDG